MSERYVVRGSPVNVVATIRHLGSKFRVSRPVERDGQRRRQGWMLSLDGHAMAFLKDCEQAEAVSKFTKLLERETDRDRLSEAVAKTIRDQSDPSAAELPYR